VGGKKMVIILGLPRRVRDNDSRSPADLCRDVAAVLRASARYSRVHDGLHRVGLLCPARARTQTQARG